MADWSTACLDWEERLTHGRSLVPDLPLFDEPAARALRVFKRLRVPDLIGKPPLGDVCGDWFFPIVAAIFGSYDPVTRQRMLQEFFLLVPKGNSKSSYCGPVMLTAAIVNERPEAEFQIVAPTLNVANIAFRQAVGTVKADPELVKLFHVREHVRQIVHRTTGAVLAIKAADTDTVTGGKVVGTMVDETHVFAKKSNAADIFVELRGALAKRPDGFLLQTTTQSKEPPSGVFRTELANARDVRDGKISLPMLAVLYEYPDEILDGHKWRHDRKLWAMVNPNMGRSVNEDYLDRELEKADSENGSAEQRLLIASQHFNVEIGLRMRGDAWSAADLWEGAGDPTLTLDELLARSEVAVAGIDGGGLDDLFGLAVAGRDKVTKQWLFWAHAWCVKRVLDLRKDIAPKLLDFAGDGDLTICDTGTAIIAGVVEYLVRVRASDLFPARSAIGLDPQAMGPLCDALSDAGFVIASDGAHGQVVAVAQGYKLSSAVWSLEFKLYDSELVHAGRPMMAWCVGNVRAEQKGNAVYMTKETAGKAKIDPLVALLNAAKLMERSPEAVSTCVPEIVFL